MSSARRSAGGWWLFAALMGATSVALLIAGWAADRVGGVRAEPAAVLDAAEGATRLDLSAARFGQSASGDLALVLSTHAAWQPRDLNPRIGRVLCLWLRGDAASKPGGRICAVRDDHAKSGVGLRYTALDHAGKQLGIRALSTVVQRPQPTTISAHFAPGLLRLVPGGYHWYVRSTYARIEDRLPDRGEVAAQIAISPAPAARLRCFGAASRNPRHRCKNPRLRHAVVPAPDDAVFSQNSPCTPLDPRGLLFPCSFGVATADARATIALVGDSHAAQWRAALEIVAQHKRWSGFSITLSGCPFSRTTSRLEPPSRRRGCVRWNRQLPRWLAKHPKIRTLFVSDHAAEQVLVPPGRSELDARIDGFVAAWKALPATITRVVVIRDTPYVGYEALDCIQRAQARHRSPGPACAVPRDVALKPDASVIAARGLRSKRVRVVDMSRFLCGRRQCLPVIGGALVYKDSEHFTDVFAYTLGPYLLRAIDRL